MQLPYPFALESSDRPCGGWVRAAAVVACLHLAGFVSAAPPAALPDFRDVTQAVESHLATLPNYQAGDLIGRSQISAALARVELAGWKIPEADEIVDLALADDSFLARELSTSAGRKFMRRIARQNGAYARLDRLSSISRGQTIVRDLIRQPGGDQLVKYLATTNSGHNLGSKLAGARGGADLNKPTGRIYTADDLVAELQRVYEKAAP